VPHPAVVARPTAAAAAAAGGREELRESGAELVAEEAVDERVLGSMSAHKCQRSSAEDRAPTRHGHHGHTTTTPRYILKRSAVSLYERSSVACVVAV